MARRPRSKAGRALKSAGDRVLGWLTIAALGLLRRLDRRRMANLVGGLMRRVGPWLPEHRIGRDNLAAAFPDKSPQEIEKILAGVWDNLGRYAAEFAHIDRMTIYNPASTRQPTDFDAAYDQATYDRLTQLRDSGKPSLVFSAHLANWELPACAPKIIGMPTSILYRRPNIGATVYTTVGDDEKIAKAKALGADHVINYRTDRFEGVVRKLTAKKGVDVAFEHVGPDTFNGSLLCLKRGGRLVTCGSTSGQSTQINLFQLYLQQYRIIGSFGCTIKNVHESLAKMASRLTPVIDTEVPLANVAEALARLEGRQVFGKIIVTF